MKISKIRAYLEKSQCGMELCVVLRKLRIVNLLHLFQDVIYINSTKGKKELNDKREFYENHMNELREVRKWLADLKSVKTYDSILKYRTTRKRKFLRGG